MSRIPYDAFASLSRLVDPWERFTLLEVGAGIGGGIEQCLDRFHAADIWAIEPEPDSFIALSDRFAAASNVHVFKLAAGQSEGESVLHVRQFRGSSSLLETDPSTDRSTASWQQTTSRVPVRTVALDEWSTQAGLKKIDLLSIDVQGTELAVLQSARALIARNCKAIRCVAPAVTPSASNPDHCGSFADVSALLGKLGFELYQIHNTPLVGSEQRTATIEGLWLRREWLAQLTSLPAIDLEFSPAADFRRLLKRCKTMGFQRIAIYGAGKDLRTRAAALDDPPATLDCIIDDSPSLAGTTFMGLPIVPLREVSSRNIDCVVLSSGAFEDRMLAQCRQHIAGDVAIVPVRQSHPEFIGKHPLIRSADQLRPAAPQLETQLELKTDNWLPLDVFHHSAYRRITEARLAHLASLKLDNHLRGARVLEVGAGVGDLTGFFAERGCTVLATDVRPENVEVMRRRFARTPSVTAGLLDLERINPADEQAFDIVFCYGVLYHLATPAESLEAMSRLCRGILLLETCVSYGQHEAINIVSEHAHDPSQAARGTGCRPTRPWVLARLHEHFEHVYMPVTQPAHLEFPLDWSAGDRSSPLHRAVFVASRTPINNLRLTSVLPVYQGAA